ncbi:hypothetical protein [Chitinophaga rhizosphaerae]|uniref:hypothetical protein n=1 Tax=Chitinophaga rhizosphaerae TaxID=1864947 RepID=UPI000F7FDEEB|nr:hypothetical protein [Chitinophaga rhizosphaerae]
MEEALKKAWQDLPAEKTSPAALRGIIHRHPARRAMRRQMILEIVLLAVFLFVYYDFFDGDRRPWGANALLVAAVAWVIVHNVAGWVYSCRALQGDHLQEMVRQHVSGMRRFAVLSVVSRVGMLASLLVFFCYGMEWNAWKGWLLAATGVVALAQMTWLGSIWQRRIRNISRVLEE